MGGLRRLSVAVVVNYRRIVDAAGKVTIKPLTTVELAQINELVKEAMGFNKERGDTYNVANSPFNGVDRPVEAVAVVDWWRDPGNIALAKESGKYLVTALVLLYLFFRVLRPMLRPVMRKIDEVAADPQEAHAPTLADAEPHSVGQLEVVEEGGARDYRENLTMAKKLAQDDPRVVANVIKAWVGNNE